MPLAKAFSRHLKTITYNSNEIIVRTRTQRRQNAKNDNTLCSFALNRRTRSTKIWMPLLRRSLENAMVELLVVYNV